ncbi:hypothetical protein ScPMuIL_015716 [Solemya velum]
MTRLNSRIRLIFLTAVLTVDAISGIGSTQDSPPVHTTEDAITHSTTLNNRSKSSIFTQILKQTTTKKSSSTNTVHFPSQYTTSPTDSTTTDISANSATTDISANVTTTDINVNSTRWQRLNPDRCYPSCTWNLSSTGGRYLQFILEVVVSPLHTCGGCECGSIVVTTEDNGITVCSVRGRKDFNTTNSNAIVIVNSSTPPSNYTILYRAVNREHESSPATHITEPTMTSPPTLAPTTPTVLRQVVKANSFKKYLSSFSKLTNLTSDTVWEWEIHSSRAQVELEILALNVTDSFGCTDGSLEILDGSSRLLNICGPLIVKGPIRSNSIEMTVIYRPTDILSGRLRLSYQEVGFISSMNMGPHHTESEIEIKYTNRIPRDVNPRGGPTKRRRHWMSTILNLRRRERVSGRKGRTMCHGIERYTATTYRTAGAISSLNYPNHYSNNLNCFYSISAPLGFVIKLVVYRYEIEESRGCVYDKLSFYNGATVSQANEIGDPICGTGSNSIYTSTNNSLLVWFHTDGSNWQNGFQIAYRALDQRAVTTAPPMQLCRGTKQVHATAEGMIGAGNTLHQPNSKGGVQCIWNITAPVGFVVVIQLNYHIDMGSSDCRGDTLTIEDHNAANSSVVTICGPHRGDLPGYFSKSNSVSIVYYRRGGSSGSRYQFLYKSHSFGVRDLTCADNVPISNRLVATDHGITITSPGYPYMYKSNERITWVVWNPTWNKNSYIDVRDSTLEYSDICNYDFVNILAGTCKGNINMYQVGKFCGSSQPKYRISNSEFVFIVFKTDGTNQNKGFTLELYNHYIGTTTTTSAPSTYCSTPTRLVADTTYQELYPSDHPGQYARNLNCTWHITGNSGYPIMLKVHDLDMEPSTGCTFDRLTIYDGLYTRNTVIAALCGRDDSDIPTYMSTGSHVTIQFHTDGSNQGQGFYITYYTSYQISLPQGCSDNVPASRRLVASATEHFISSPRYPLDYHNNQEMYWLIYKNSISSQPMYLILHVVDSHLEVNRGCTYDYVEVFDGTCETSTTIGKFCGRQTPKYAITGDSRYIKIKFRSDSSNNYKGFRMGYKLSTDSEDETPEKDNTVPIAVGTSCGVLIIILVIGITCGIMRKNRAGATPPPTVAYSQANLLQ